MPEQQQQQNIELPHVARGVEMHCDGVGCTVHIGGVLWFAFALSDKTTWRYAAVLVYHSGQASQIDIARQWGVSTRTVNTWVNAYREGGIAELGDHRGRPVVVTDEIKRHIGACHRDGMDVNEIARRLTLSTGSVCEVLYGKRKLIDATLPGFENRSTDTMC